MRRYSYSRTLLHCLPGNVSLWVRCFVIVAVSSAAVFCPVSGFAEMDLPREYKIKMAFIYNFTKFITWPETDKVFKNTDDFVGITIGGDPFGVSLQEFSEKITVKGKRAVIRNAASAREIEACHILFISASEESNLKQILDKVKWKPVLTVSDTAGFAQKGVIINFFVEENRIRFEINLRAAKKAGFNISSDLLKLARIVTEMDE